jgi:hypothetical protein
LKLWVKGCNGSSIPKEFMNRTIKFKPKKFANKLPPSFSRSKNKNKKMLQGNKKINRFHFNLFSSKKEETNKILQHINTKL